MRSLFQSISQFFRRLFKSRKSSPDQPTIKQTVTQQAVAPSEQLDLPPAPRSATSAPISPPIGIDSRVSPKLRRLMYEATYDMPQRKRTHAAQVGALLRQKDPAFSYEKYNFAKIIQKKMLTIKETTSIFEANF